MTNDLFTHVGGWDSLDLSQNNVIFVICIIAAILHFLLWFQMIIQKPKIDLTFLLSVVYLLTDVLLVSSYFIQYAIRIRSWIPITRLTCYFEAYFMFYVNLFESFSLTALNICRFWKIVRNRNIYTVHRRRFIIGCIAVPLFVLMNLIIQDTVGWCVVTEKAGSSCCLSYTNILVRLWNMIIVLAIPILISFSMLGRGLRFLKNTHAEQIILRRNHHRRILVHSFIFYSIWFILWLPEMIVTYLDVNVLNVSLNFIVSVASALETLVDPVTVIFLDKRFGQVWKKSFQWIKRQMKCPVINRVHPVLEMATIR